MQTEIQTLVLDTSHICQIYLNSSNKVHAFSGADAPGLFTFIAIYLLK